MIQVHFQVTQVTLTTRHLNQSWRPRMYRPPSPTGSYPCLSLTYHKVKDLSGLSGKNTSHPSGEPSSISLKTKSNEVCLFVLGAHGLIDPPGLHEATQFFKNNNKTHPLTPLSRSLQEKRSTPTLLGTHRGNQSFSKMSGSP